MNDINADLQKLGLSQQQATIYLILLKLGALRIQAISDYTQIPRTSVYMNLKRLQELGLAEEITSDGFKLFRPLPLDAIKVKLQEDLEKIQATEDTLEILSKKLASNFTLANTDVAELRYYKNRAGARQILWNTLKASNNVYVYSAWGRSKGCFKKIIYGQY